MPSAHRLVASVVAGAALLLASTPALAFRCGRHLISEGDPAVMVRALCGPPASVEQRVVYRAGIPRQWPTWGTGTVPLSDQLVSTDRAVEEVTVEDWTYNFGPRLLMPRIRFENGRVAAIEWLGYGYPVE